MLMVTEGLARKEAAQAAGMTDHSLYTALCKPHVMAFKNGVLRDHRAALAEKSLNRIDGLADNAKNDSTKLQANKILLEQDVRFQPAPPSFNVQTNISVGFTPGYVIDITGSDINSDQVIDLEPAKQDQ